MVRLQRTNDATLGSRQTAKNGVLIPPKRGCNIINLGIFNFRGSNFKRNIFGEKVVQTYTLDLISLKV
jgi:hypothetical protein